MAGHHHGINKQMLPSHVTPHKERQTPLSYGRNLQREG